MNNFKEEIVAYIDNVGLVQNRTPTEPVLSTSGNGLLFTAEALVNLSEMGELDLETAHRFFSAYMRCQLEPGLFIRHPANPEQEGIDDYIGVGAASYILTKSFPGEDFDMAGDVLEYGQRHKYYGVLPYYYGNEFRDRNNDVRAWLGRFPALLCHLNFACGKKPSLFQRIWWAGSVLLSTRQPLDNKDARILSWLMIKTMDNRDWICNLVTKYFYKKLNEQYGSMREVFRQYFNNGHPLERYSVD